MAKIYKDDMFPICPGTDPGCPYFNKKDFRCYMFQMENIFPFGECEYFDDEEEEKGEE